jgi:hypothetical protein
VRHIRSSWKGACDPVHAYALSQGGLCRSSASDLFCKCLIDIVVEAAFSAAGPGALAVETAVLADHKAQMCCGLEQVRGKQSERRVARPKSHSEQAALLCSLIQEAVELPPLPLSPASQRRWALEFEGDTLRTLRRMPDNCGCVLCRQTILSRRVCPVTYGWQRMVDRLGIRPLHRLIKLFAWQH